MTSTPHHLASMSSDEPRGYGVRGDVRKRLEAQHRAHPDPAVRELMSEASRAAYAEAVQAFNDLHLMHANTTGCWGGLGGSAMTPECAIDCVNPKHQKAQEAWRNICRKAQGEAI